MDANPFTGTGSHLYILSAKTFCKPLLALIFHAFFVSFTNYILNEKTRTIYLLDGDSLKVQRPLVDLPIQWLER